MTQLPSVQLLQFLTNNRDLPMAIKGNNLELDLSAFRAKKEEEKMQTQRMQAHALFGAQPIRLGREGVAILKRSSSKIPSSLEEAQ